MGSFTQVRGGLLRSGRLVGVARWNKPFYGGKAGEFAPSRRLLLGGTACGVGASDEGSITLGGEGIVKALARPLSLLGNAPAFTERTSGAMGVPNLLAIPECRETPGGGEARARSWADRDGKP